MGSGKGHGLCVYSGLLLGVWGGSVRMPKIVFPKSADFIGQGGSLIERGLRGAVKGWVRSKSLLANMNFGEMTLSPEHSDILPFR